MMLVVAEPATVAVARAAQDAATEPRGLAAELLREMVGLRTTASHPEATRELLANVRARLLGAGFDAGDVRIVTVDGVDNLLARYPGRGDAAPILLMAHVDVVDAEPAAWQADPFTLTEIDGYYYGRGTTDNKAGAAGLVAVFLRLRAEGFEPSGDLWLVLTGDEESAQAGIEHLSKEWIPAVAPRLAINTDAGGGALNAQGEPQAFYVQTSEKLYQTFELEITNPGGHSSVPRPDNAIYDLTDALRRLQAYRFPIEVLPAMRRYLQQSAPFEAPAVGELMRRAASDPPDWEAARLLAAREPALNARLRTTCVATQLAAGHAENALPRSARATVNCRILPGHGPDEVEATLREVVANDAITFRRLADAWPSPPSPWREDIAAPIGAVVESLWPGTPVIPSMSTGATDALWVRIAGVPVYGASGLFEPAGEPRAHGLDERVGVQAFHDSVEFLYRLVRRLSS